MWQRLKLSCADPSLRYTSMLLGERFYVSQGRCVTGSLYGLCVTGPLCHRLTVWSVCHRAVVSQAHCMVCVSQGRCVTGSLYGLCVTGPLCHRLTVWSVCHGLCVTGPLCHRLTVWSVCHRAVVSQAHCMVCVSQGRSVTELKASFIGLLLQYWLILKTRNFYFLSLYI